MSKNPLIKKIGTMSANYNQKEYLIQRIHAAFEGVQLGAGVSLHETIVIDNYGSNKARQLARKEDEKKDWRVLLDNPKFVEVHGIGGLSFYDAEGFRFHLPAYLIVGILKPEEVVIESLIFTLTYLSPYQLERNTILNPLQRRCVKEFLVYCQHHTPNRFFSQELQKLETAIKHWSNVPD